MVLLEVVQEFIDWTHGFVRQCGVLGGKDFGVVEIQVAARLPPKALDDSTCFGISKCLLDCLNVRWIRQYVELGICVETGRPNDPPGAIGEFCGYGVSLCEPEAAHRHALLAIDGQIHFSQHEYTISPFSHNG